MAPLIYSLCALTSITCLLLLWRSWRQSGHRLLFWSALCFLGLAINNVLLVIDKLLLPVDVSLYQWRITATFAAVVLLLFGLVWEDD